MKRRSLIFFGLAAVFLAAGLLSGQRVFYVLLFCQLVMLAAGASINLWAALSFTYTQELASGTTLRGRPVQLNLAIHNEKPVPFPLLSCRINLGDAQIQEHSFSLAARDFAHFNLTVPCQHRGQYQIGLASIDFIDLFGLWRMPFAMRLLPYYRPKELLVYPQLVQLAKLKLPQLDSPGSSRPDLADDSQYPYAMTRKYRPGDRASQIHWQVSLRQRSLMTRLYDRQAQPGVELVLDLHTAGYLGLAARQAQDVFCETAAALVFYLLRQNRPLQLKAYGQEEINFKLTGLADFQPLYKWLAAVSFTDSGGLAEKINHTSGASRIILTCRHHPALARLGKSASFAKGSQLILAGPARDNLPSEPAARLYQQQNIPLLSVNYGDDLARKLQAGS